MLRVQEVKTINMGMKFRNLAKVVVDVDIDQIMKASQSDFTVVLGVSEKDFIIFSYELFQGTTLVPNEFEFEDIRQEGNNFITYSRDLE